MEIKKENLVAAYNTADESGKKMLQALFPEEQFEQPQAVENIPVTERIKTFDDACRELGSDHPFVKAYKGYVSHIHQHDMNDYDLLAYLKIRIIFAALNDGWEPQFSTNEWSYHPCFFLYRKQEIEVMDEDKKFDTRMMNTDDYITNYDGFAYAQTNFVSEMTGIGYRLLLRTKELAEYCGKQFIGIWADYLLPRKDA